MSTILVLMVFPLLLALAAGWDLASYTIPNVLSLALVAVFVLFALFVGLPASALGSHFAAGLIGLLASFSLFAGGFIGGGDAKLYAATALWFGFSDLLPYTLVAAALGGALSLILITVRGFPLPSGMMGQAWIVRLHDAKAGIPYGVALAAGALLVLPEAQIFHFVTVP